ncbi:hypothetical protein U9M48_008080 [Paspalum notatum var. saurae]|uniref:Uncharacterized protein n=1 Tax=Paspalum notatum var. saurae TaxID=547442 RepID=A0AAQ3WCS1_PASNO
MAKVKCSTPAPAPPPSPAASVPAATAATAKGSASAGEANRAPKGSAVAPPLVVIDVQSSPESIAGGGAAKGRSGGSEKKGRKRAAPRPLDLDDEVEMWTPREKRRLDEECQILCGDPLAAAIEVAPIPAAANDDIAVVAERGKVACRDFPHPRSACAKNPFSTTPHERHCEKCFCYVCDIAAPCVFWKGHGGHCHASDRDKKWKTLRFMRQKAKPS